MRSRVNDIRYRNIFLLLTLSLSTSFYSVKNFGIRRLPVAGANSFPSADRSVYFHNSEGLRPLQKLTPMRNLADFAIRPPAGPPYTIPVVFHIISSNPYSITDPTIINAVQDLNDAFAHAGAYAVGPPGANTQITFCLAKIDPNGGNTTGITRTQSVLGSFDQDIENDAMKSLVSWDTKTYCNIWLVDTVQNESLTSFSCGKWTRFFNNGYATFSGGGDYRDGIVTTGFGAILAALMGKYLGLKTTFSPSDCTNNNCSTDGDGICDTPPSSVIGGSCTSPQNSCTTDTISGFTVDVPDLTSNFMSMSGACANEFTTGQANKMQSNLTTVRGSLLVQNKCNPPCSENIVASFTRDNWSPAQGDLINFSSTSTGGTNYQWTVNGIVVGSNSASYSQSFLTSGKYQVTLKVYNANPNCYATYSDMVIVTCGVTARFTPNVRQIAAKKNILLDSILFTNKSVNATSYAWWMSNNAGMSPQIVSTQISLNYVFDTPGQYSVWLIATNGSCSDTTEKFNFPVLDPTFDGVMGISGAQCYKNDSIKITMRICNNGYSSSPTGTPVSFYDDDPSKTTTNKLSPTFYLPFPVEGRCCNTFTFTVASNKPHLNQLFGVFNDSGTTKPLKLPNTLLPETNYANNIGTISNFQFQVVASPPTATLQPGDTLQLSAQSGPDSTASIVWSTPQNMSCINCINPSYIGEYEVDTITKTVIATSALGCADTSFAILKIPPYDDFTIKIDSADCAGTDSMVVNFSLCNNFKRGYIPQGLTVSLYDGDPALASSNLLGPIFSTPAVNPGLCASYVQSFKRTGTNMVYALVNDKDTTNTIQIPGDSLFLESNYSNNSDSFHYKSATVILTPSDTTVYNKQSVMVGIVSPIYDVNSTTWLPGAGYSLSCTSCLSPTVTVSGNAIVQMQTANKYGCFIKGIDTINIFPPDMTVEILGTNCYTNNTTRVKFRICMNNYYDTIFANLPVSFYDGNPFTGSPNLLAPTFYTQNQTSLTCDSFTQVVTTPTTGILYAVVNDKGGNISSIPDKAFDETDYSNDSAAQAIVPFIAFAAPTDTTVMRFSSVQIKGSVTGGQITNYSWEPDEFLSCANCLTPVVTPPYSIKYEFIAQNEYACTDTAFAEIKTFAGGNVDIPNAFTPNGDGKNDIFYILGSNKIKMIKEFSIFDRYGGKIFAVSNVPANDPSYGWNGNINGKRADMGAYAYFAIILFNDGSQQEYKGTVLVIR
jgi:gliding motility-associated-like protein